MLEKILENSIKNSGLKLEFMNESTISAEFYEQMVGEILKDRIKSFLGHHIGDVQPLSQPAGYIFARIESGDTFKLVRKSVVVEENKKIVTVSDEAWEDLINMTKLSDKSDTKIPSLFMNWVKSCTGNMETNKLLNFLKTNATESDPLILNDNFDNKQNAENNLFFIHKKVSDLVISMNSDHYRTYDNFCILPQKSVGGILGLSFTYSRIDDSSDENRANDYFMGKINNTRYYLNPSPNENYAIVGLHSKKEKGVSSLIYAPYALHIGSAINNVDEWRTLAIFARNAYVLNPLHDQSPMLYKFRIDVE